MIFAQSEATAARRRFAVYLVDATNGLDPETGEAGGQPQISKNGGAFGNTTATLTAIGNGAYYVELTAAELDTAGNIIVRYKSANTAEFSMPADVLALNVHDSVPAVDVTTYLGAAAPALVGGRYDASVGAIAANVITAAATAPDFATEVNTGIATAAALAAVQADTDDIQGRLPVALVGGRMDSSVGAMAANVMTAAAADPGLTTELQAGLATAAALATVQADTDDIQGRLPAALTGGKMEANVGSMATNVITAAATAADFAVEVNASVLAVLGALADAAADGDPTAADTLMAYVKQVVNTLVGTAGVVTYPASAVPASGVSLAEAIRQIYDETAGLNGASLTNLDAAVSTRATQASVDAIQADTNDLQTNLAAVATPAQVLTQVNAALDTAVAQPTTGAPPVNPSIRNAVAWLFKAFRNKATQTTSQYSLYDDAGSVVEQKATFADDGTTATKGELASGP